MKGTARSGETLPIRVVGAWSLVNISGNLMNVSLSAVIPAFYATYTNVTLTQVGAIFLIIRLYDGLVDPVIGFVSDRTKTVIGARKPWIILGVIISCIATVLLFNPSVNTGPTTLFVYLAIFVTGHSLLQVPHGAWGSELSRNQRDRNRISGAMPLAGIIGTLIFMSVPVVLPYLGLATTSEIDPNAMSYIGSVMLVVIPACAAIAIGFAPSRPPAVAVKANVPELIKSLRYNAPFIWFMTSYSMTAMSYGIYYGAGLLFFTHYLSMGAEYPFVYSLMSTFYALAIPLLTVIQQKAAPNRLWAIGALVMGLFLPLQLLAPLFFAPLALIIGVVFFRSLGAAATEVPRLALIADCVDYGLLKNNVNFAASYYAVYHFVGKAFYALGGGLCLVFIGWAGFDPKDAEHTRSALAVLGICAAVLPALLLMMSGFMFWKFPLDARRQRIIRKRLEQRTSRRTAAQPLPIESEVAGLA